MNSKDKVVDRETQDEIVGVLTAISIVSKRLARRLLQLDESAHEAKSTSPPKGGAQAL